ncbi:hypothetical protein H7K45_02045 [Mycobacterium yunnanensis]|uniref:Uncharacterized protein n=1 Tax=Mycobacterium yunnanensis TaxID=368477 RepID=A0A9X2YX03_9MYCO|nr:hypothetical protein [Mycobacterium yunnanensis]MCV7419311.1 hypothetical protein [Mycobacterium yunnanensis]
MSSFAYRAARGRYASLGRSRPDDDPELVASRVIMQELALIDAISRALMKAPPVREEIREQIIALLAPSEGVLA